MLDDGVHTLHFGGTTNDFTGPDPTFTVKSITVDATDAVTVRTGPTAIPLPAAMFAGLPALAAQHGQESLSPLSDPAFPGSDQWDRLGLPDCGAGHGMSESDRGELNFHHRNV